MIWILISVVLSVVSLWLRWRYKNMRLVTMAEKLPGPPTVPFLGNALLFMCQPEELIIILRKLIDDYGQVFRFWLGPDLNVVVSNPDDLKLLLTSSKTNSKGPQYKYMADILGGGILSGSGPTWRRHRKIASPNYGKRAIGSYDDIFNREVDLLLNKLKEIDKEHPFDIYSHIVCTTSFTVCQTLMGLSREQTVNLPEILTLIKTTQRLYDIVFDRMTKWYLQVNPVFWFTRHCREQKIFVKRMMNFSEAIIELRVQRLKTLEYNLKIDLMKAEDDEIQNTQLSVIDRFILSQEFNYSELLKETFTIFTSSQEASAKISSFILLMMAYHPHYQNKLYAEITSVIGDRDRYVTDRDLKLMPYLDMVFKEVLRLFPIATMLQRTINEDIEIATGTIPAGSSLMIPIYHIHRDPRFWERPDDFNPERFNPENSKLRRANCYVPFSLGNMDCLGRYFGAKLIKTICVRVLREYEIFSRDSYQDLRLSIAISASSLNGFNVKLKPRK